MHNIQQCSEFVMPRLTSNKFISCYGCNRNIRSSAHSCNWKDIVQTIFPNNEKSEWITPETTNIYKNIKRANNQKLIIANGGWITGLLVLKYNCDRDKVVVSMETGTFIEKPDNFVGFKYNDNNISTDKLIYSETDFVNVKCISLIYNAIIDDLSV